MKYKVALHHSEEGVSVSVPALPGCWSEGDTEEEALENIRDAIREYLEALEERCADAEMREIEITLPRHNPIKAFTMGRIVQDAGLTVDEFRKLL